MSERHTVTLRQGITVYHDMFDHMDGVMRSLAKKMTQSKEDWFFAEKLACQKLSKHYSDVTPTTGKILISAYILDPIRMLGSFRF
jgi:phage gpG-like protein